MGPAAKFLSLSRRDRGLLVAAALTLARTAIGLRTIGFDAMRRRAAGTVPGRHSHSWCGPPPRRTVAPPPADRIAWSVGAATRVVPGGSNCLVRALATQAMLTRHGYPSELKIGVRKADHDRIAAHAWLECADAIVVGDFELDSYTALRAPAAAPASAVRDG